MDWLASVDIYCERIDPGFWAEPVNALSNGAFIAASLWGAVVARRYGTREPVVWLLIALAALIGLGSFLFHSFATIWSSYADTVPIWTFVAVFVLSAMRLVGGVAPRRIAVIAISVVAVLTVVFLAADDPAPTTTPPVLNGSGQYAPAIIALAVFAILSWRRGHPIAPWAIGAAIVFAASLLFRTVDIAVCPSFPIGTHFLWHLLNGAMIALLLHGLIRNLAVSPARS